MVTLLFVAGGAALWPLWPSRQPALQPGARFGTGAEPLPVRARSILGARENPAAPADVASAGPPPVISAVPPQPKHHSLAAAAEPPAGPEVGPGLTPLAVLENLRSVFRQFSTRFGGNPVGSNSEITATLNGENPKQVGFLNPEDGLRINDQGELIDNWGTPFFFHQLSRTEMEIRSAGPDRKMWTRDDLVIK